MELQFTIGEALSCAGAGRKSEVARDPWVVEQLKSTESNEVGGTMQELIDMIVSKYATSTIPYVRQVCHWFCFSQEPLGSKLKIFCLFQAACIWLLSLVKHSGDHKVVQVWSFFVALKNNSND